MASIDNHRAVTRSNLSRANNKLFKNKLTFNIMELIKVTETNGINAVSARELYIGLGYDLSHYGRWAKKNITDNPFFAENEDWVVLAIDGENLLGGRPTKDYALSLTMAKKLAMMAKTEVGDKYRDYLIECEKKLKQLSLPSYQIDDKILRAKKWIQEQEEKRRFIEDTKRMKPKEEFYDTVTNSYSAFDMKTVANTLNLGIGRNTLFKILRDKSVLTKNNLPYQTFINRGYFRVIEEVSGCGNFVNPKVVVYQKGVDFILKLINNKVNIENYKHLEVENQMTIFAE